MIGLEYFWNATVTATVSISVMLGVGNPDSSMEETRPISIVRPAVVSGIPMFDDATGTGYTIVDRLKDDVAATPMLTTATIFGSEVVNRDFSIDSSAQLLMTLRDYLDGSYKRATFVTPNRPATMPKVDQMDRRVETEQARTVNSIRESTGLSWPRVASLVGVERQTLYRWRNGEHADGERFQRAVAVLDVIHEARTQYGNERALRAWLNKKSPLEERSPFELLSEGRIDEAMVLAMLAPSRVTSISDVARDTSRWDQHLAIQEREYID